MARMKTRITDLHFDLLREIMICLARSSDGATNIARAASACKDFLKCAKDTIVLRNVAFEGTSPLFANGKLPQIIIFLDSCACAGNVKAHFCLNIKIKRTIKLLMLYDPLIHATQCFTPQCQYNKCRELKGLFRHSSQCQTRVLRGCILCKALVNILRVHALCCKESKCKIPHCRAAKEVLRGMKVLTDPSWMVTVMGLITQGELQRLPGVPDELVHKYGLLEKMFEGK